MPRQFPNNQAEEVARSMRQLRKELDEDVHQIKRSAATLTDWQYYIRNYPWLSIGAASLVGYLLVPRKLEIQSPDAETLSKLARKNRLVVEHQPEKQASHGGLQSAASFLTGLVVKAVAAQVMHHLADRFSLQESGDSRLNTGDAQDFTEAGASIHRFDQNGD